MAENLFHTNEDVEFAKKKKKKVSKENVQNYSQVTNPT